MSDFTDFFPAAGAASGGSGGLTSDPNDLERAYWEATFIKGNYADNSRTAAFWNNIIPVFGTRGMMGTHVVLPADSTTYQTVIDVTNTGKGGTINNVVGPGRQKNTNDGTANEITFKFTVDGTVTEILANATNAQIGYQQRVVFGSYLVGANGGDTAYWSNKNVGNFWNNPYNYNGFVGISSASYANIFIPDNLFRLNRIIFKDTFKLEVKASSFIAQTLYYNYCGIVMTTNP